MANKTFASLAEFFSQHRIVLLLAAILSMIIGSPFLDDIFHYRVIPDIFITIVLISGIYAISRKKKHIYIALALAIPMFVGIWSSRLYQSPKPMVFGLLFGKSVIMIRYNPDKIQQGENPLTLDSRPRRMKVEEYMGMENRFTMLMKSKPALAKQYADQAQKDAESRYKQFQYLAAREGVKIEE